ncbi:MAG: hypothetical protein H6R19_382 [Proteobacteria bacterium]|nr:hypothetical protein [Pseudomonadota bacterium]
MANREVLFKRINNALFDMQAATSQTFEQHFLTYARLFSDSSLQLLNQKLTANLDVERFLEASSKLQGRMGGRRVSLGLKTRTRYSACSGYWFKSSRVNREVC